MGKSKRFDEKIDEVFAGFNSAGFRLSSYVNDVAEHIEIRKKERDEHL